MKKMMSVASDKVIGLPSHSSREKLVIVGVGREVHVREVSDEFSHLPQDHGHVKDPLAQAIATANITTIQDLHDLVIDGRAGHQDEKVSPEGS
jgi:hypothetical protein